MSDPLLGPLLKGVSRSFFLTLWVLPPDLKEPMGLAYLLARAADTLADLPSVNLPDRLLALDYFRRRLREKDSPLFKYIADACRAGDAGSSEIILLRRLSDCLQRYDGLENGDREKVSRLLMTLTQGMMTDLTVFHGENPRPVVALKTRRDLESYTYSVAGCVGKFWTEMVMAHRPSCSHWDPEAMPQMGIRFGQGLQMTNILRDLP
ncbi:MAG: squalene/phytoene synthase family protein, partial [Candidatus Tectomicrobia bacterium]|nr:squalene/phytoene synthase family protein [Candidatus Tectomicrobia bacterium]